MRPRIHYTESQKALMWERWQKGESLQQIAQVFDRNHSSIQGILAVTGGIRPAPRCRSRWALTLAEREEISRAVVAGHSLRSIALHLGRAPSTISRELKRNGGQVCYRASQAERPPGIGDAAPRPVNWYRTERWRASWQASSDGSGRRSRLPVGSSALIQTIRAVRCHPETIYRSLFIQARGALKKELVAHLRRRRVMRRSRHHTQKTDDHGRITNAVSISERRPAWKTGRCRVTGKATCCSAAGTARLPRLVERQTRYVMLVKVAGKDTETVIDALIKNARKLPEELYKSLTWDRGKEMADHKRFTLATDIKVYFCDPQNPWQRGSNENTNGLLRQYFPKGTDLSGYSQAKLNAVARRLNERPRKTLNFETPAERFHQTVASIG